LCTRVVYQGTRDIDVNYIQLVKGEQRVEEAQRSSSKRRFANRQNFGTIDLPSLLSTVQRQQLPLGWSDNEGSQISKAKALCSRSLAQDSQTISCCCGIKKGRRAQVCVQMLRQVFDID
jgi:hypothetical protein